MSANLDHIDLNSDVVSVEPENDVGIKLGFSNPETLTDVPVLDQVDGLVREMEMESVDRGINLEMKIGSIEDESREVVQVTETKLGEVEENRLGQVEEEVKDGVCSISVFDDSIKVQNVDDSALLPGVIDVEVKQVNNNDFLPLKDVSRVSTEVNSDMEIDDRIGGSSLFDAGICQENGENDKSSALNLVVDLNPYVSTDENESGNANVKVADSKLEFSVSDLVWGKVRSHPWWPGQIFDPSASSDKAKKYFKRDSYLIAYFGDQTFAWNEASMIKPFRSHFSQMEKQSNSEEFHYAIDCALDEVSRRAEFGLACPCISEYSMISNQIIVNAGIQEDYSGRRGGDSFSSADAFEPAEFVDYIKALGQLPFGVVDKLEFVTAQAQLLAFSHWKGYSQLPEFQILGTLLLSDEHDSELNEKAVAEIKDDEYVSSGKEKSKSQDSSTPKRKNISGDGVYPRKKEKSLAELFAERRLSIPNSKSGLGIKAACKSISSSSGKKRKAIDSIPDDSVLKHSKSISSSDGENNSSQPKRTYRVGDSILKVASQLNGPTLMRKPHNGASQECAMKDKNKEKCLSRKSEGKELFQIVDCSSGEMVSQLCLVARDPRKGCSFLKSLVIFFVEFRNSVCLASSPQHEQSFLECIFDDNIGKESSKSEVETCESEHMKDSCSTDMIIQSGPQELQSPENQNEAGDIPSETTTQKIPPVELQPTDQSSPSLDSEKQGAGEILDMEAIWPVGHLEEHCSDDDCATALILNFTHSDSIPSESNLNKIFSRYGRVKESETEVLKKSSRAKVVFFRRDDAEAAFSSAGKYSIFGPSLVSYRLKYMHSKPSKSSLNTTKRSKKNANSAEGNTI